MSRTSRSCHELGVCHGRTDQGCTCHHDTETLPPGGYYFAPGAIDGGPHRRKRLAGWQRLVLDIAACLAVAGLIGFAAGVLQAKGWPL
ncbi:hypothetical protein C380_18190 [Acidovorax sp. KKS102]|uniref:hypothetical protein n=1 Tax=Acidovorax sp. KKS102 TaxID=358220 RepID=UPI00028A93BC|nr:hypothetical protein [Acidovorax sp. KKS102]AFU47332.1 hypothetical protein C380_18190 [Acidovorax sp. KKS102]